MIFGALMLDREPESYPRLLRRVGKMAGLVLGWSAIYFAVDVMRGEESFSITTFFLRIYESNWNFSFWYLYTYIALLMTLPLLQKFAQGLNDRDFLYLFGLFFLFSCFLPTAEFFLSRGGGGTPSTGIGSRAGFLPVLWYIPFLATFSGTGSGISGTESGWGFCGCAMRA